MQTGRLGLWFDIIRPRTLAASAAPVAAAVAYAFSKGCFRPWEALLCLLFALTAQIASNLANDYFDFRAGLDGKDRVGPRRHLASGDVTQGSMLAALAVSMSLAAALGLALLAVSGRWELIWAGVAICAAALAYSGGPFPLSRLGLGDVAVVLFFGVAAVCLTFYVQAGYVDWGIVMLSLGVGAAADNILVVNNYRDYHEDSASGKHTSIVAFGRKFGLRLYYWNGVAAAFLGIGAAAWGNGYGADEWLRGYFVMAFYLLLHTYAHQAMKTLDGPALNPLLGKTARNLLVFVAMFIVVLLTDMW